MRLIDLDTDDLKRLIDSAVNAVVSKPVPSVMTKRQLAEYLQKPLSTINRYMRAGMPHRKEGKDYPEFYKPEIDRWLENRFVAVQKIQGQTNYAEGQELEARNVVFVEKNGRAHHSQSTSRSANKRAGRASGG